MMDQALERDCTVKCRSSTHGKQILNCVSIATAAQIRSYSVWLCHNFTVVTDEFGRNLLHLASACGKWEIVEWLSHYCNVDVDIKDWESGWTALHRSLFYGQLLSAKILSLHGASLRIADHEGFTPLDILLKDRLPYVEYLPSSPSEVYAWGSNFNYNLGLGNLQSREIPEILEVFRKDSVSIKQVAICKFHSAFLSTNGRIYTCGYGHGGRLGQGTEDISLIPSIVKGVGVQNCIQIAAGQDHLLLLIEGGQVWSCGLNTYHQLGLIPPVERCLVPKPLSLKFLKGKGIIGIHAARFHSVICTADSVYTFGLNAGQLGHAKGDRTQINPRQVSALFNEEWHITHVEASDGATVCATSRGDVYVLHEYQIRKIASRQLEILKLSVVGGHLDSRCDVAGVREGGGLELRVILLTKSGKVYLWRQTDPYLRRCIFTLPKQLIISDIHINHYSIGMITSDNEGYMGSIIPFKGQRSAPPSSTLHTPTLFSTRPSAGLNVLLNTDDCNFIKVKRLPHIFRGTSITSDSKGRNFAVLQSTPKMGLVEIPSISESNLLFDFSKLYSETSLVDDFHDIQIKVGRKDFAAHKYILASRSDYFKKQLLSNNFNNGGLMIENMKPEVFEQVLKFIYCNHCDFLTQGYEVHWEREPESGKKKKSGAKAPKSSNPVALVQEASRKLGVPVLAKRLDGVRLNNGEISLLESSSSTKLSFDRSYLSELSDVNLHSSSGTVFPCHKCILIARLDYFHSMLSTSWAENSKLEHLPLPISSKVMEVLLDYIYSDEANKVLDSEDPEFLCHVLMITDQLLMLRLKEICEKALVQLITLKNAAELLELSSVYNAEQLKKSCMHFISINLAAIMEAKSLEVVSVEVMQELSKYYQSLIPCNHRRIFGDYADPPQEILAFVEKTFPVSSTCTFEKSKLDSHDTKSKSKRRSNSARHDVKEISSVNRNKSNSESSEKDIVLNILIPDINELKIENKEGASPTKNKDMSVPPPNKSNSNKQAQRILKWPRNDQVLTLDEIMQEEEQKLTVLQRKQNIHDMKPLPHMSQKQKKKMMAKAESADIFIPNSPPNKSACPWAKLSEQSPPSPSFWDAVAKKDFQPSVINSELDFASKVVPASCSRRPESQNSNPVQENAQEIAISLSDIQKDEEQKLRKTISPKIKPLHILNIEDQAIEELAALYNASNNHKEKVTISRVQPEEIASPVWKKRGY